MKLALFVMGIFGGLALGAPETACVKNDLKGGTNTCEGGLFSKNWTYVYSAEADPMFEICTRKRPASFCDSAPDSFLWVVAKPSKEKVCVQNFATSLGDFCQQDPDHYAYIRVDGP
jgi:hypothetical protein